MEKTKKYFKFLGKRSKAKTFTERKNMTFKSSRV